MTQPRLADYLRLDLFVPAVRNAQQHDTETAISSIARFGFNDAPIIDERTGRAVTGHGRVKALVEMRARGMDMPAGLLMDDDGMWMMPVQRGWRSRDDAHAEAYVWLHNELGRRKEQDAPTAVAMLQDVLGADPNLFESLNIPAEQLDALFAETDMDLPDITGADEPEGDGLGPDVDPPGRDDDEPAVGKTVTCPACQHSFETRGVIG